MFEKEAKEYAQKYTFWDEGRERPYYDKSIREAFLDGAEFGYNKAKVEVEESYRESLCNSELNLASVTEQLEELEKANEWHYVKDGDLPNTELGRADVIVAYINVYGNPCRIECCFEGTDFIYWDTRIPVGWRKVDIFGKIYAWKYPEELPELPKENE